MAPAVVRHREGRVARTLGRHHHDVDRGLPRRRPAGGDRRDRAGDGPVRGRDRDGPGRGAPAQPARRPFPASPPRARRPYDSGEYAEGARRGCSTRPGYAELRAEQAARRERGDVVQLGIGVWPFVEITGGGGGCRNENATVEVHPDGTVTVLTGTSPHGQGHATAWAMLASEQLDIPVEKITVKHGDTDLVPRGARHRWARAACRPAASRSTRRRGELVEVARRAGGRHARGRRRRPAFDGSGRRSPWPAWPRPRSRWPTLAETERLRVRHGFDRARGDVPVRRARRRRRGRHRVRQGGLRPDRHRRRRGHRAQPAARRGPAARRHRPGHRAGAAGGGRLRRRRQPADRDASPTTAFPSAAELPSFTLLDMATPTHLNPLGVKGIGEAGTIGATPAVQSAVIDAVAHLGVRHIDMPTSPRTVWRAVREPATAEGADVKVEITVNGASSRADDVEPRLLLVALPARRRRAAGDQRRLRHHLVRRLHGAARRRVGEVVHGAGRAGRRARGHHHRGAVRSGRCELHPVQRRSGRSTGCSAASARRAW